MASADIESCSIDNMVVIITQNIKNDLIYKNGNLHLFNEKNWYVDDCHIFRYKFKTMFVKIMNAVDVESDKTNFVETLKSYLRLINKDEVIKNIIECIKQILSSDVSQLFHPRLQELETANVSYSQKDVDLPTITTFNGKSPDELTENEKIIFQMKVKKYKLLNTGTHKKLLKCPYNYHKNKPLAGFNKMSVSSLYKSHDESKDRWGLLLGEHELFDYHIIALDFDINNKQGTNEPTKLLFDEYMAIGNKNGMYESSTEGNHNVLINIQHSKKLKQVVDNILKSNKKKSNVTIEQLDVFLDNSYIVIPPTATMCKVNNMERPRKFLTDVYVHEMYEDNDLIEHFLLKHLWNKLKKTHFECFKNIDTSKF